MLAINDYIIVVSGGQGYPSTARPSNSEECDIYSTHSALTTSECTKKGVLLLQFEQAAAMCKFWTDRGHDRVCEKRGWTYAEMDSYRITRVYFYCGLEGKFNLEDMPMAQTGHMRFVIHN